MKKTASIIFLLALATAAIAADRAATPAVTAVQAAGAPAAAPTQITQPDAVATLQAAYASSVSKAAAVQMTAIASQPTPVPTQPVSKPQFTPVPVSPGAGSSAGLISGPASVTAPVSLAPSSISFDTSAVNSIKLMWDVKAKQNVYYNVYRSTSAEYSRINTTRTAENEYVDAKILSATVYYYKVEAMDLSNNAYMSLSRQVKSADVFKPFTPQGFKAYQDVQQIVLKWQTAQQSSFKISGYNLYRGKTEDKQEFVKFVPGTKTSYNDEEVEPAIRYYYRITTEDVSGAESVTSEASSTMAYPPARTGLVLMSTGYRNNIFDNMGFNVDVGFSYYIGSIYGSHDVEPDGRGTDAIKKMGIWLLNVDGKYTYFNEYDKWPSIALGISYSVLLQDSIGGNSDTRSKQATFSVGQSILSIQGLYITASKKLPYENTVHAGFSMGAKLKDSPGRGIAAFMPYLASSFVTPAASRSVDTSLDLRNAYYLGYSRPIFNKMGIRLEYIVPIDVNRSINKNPILPDNYIINTHIDRLLNFDIGYLHYSGGYAWVGYINLRFTVFPSPYK